MRTQSYFLAAKTTSHADKGGASVRGKSRGGERDKGEQANISVPQKGGKVIFAP